MYFRLCMQATLVEYNLGQVDQAITAVNVALAQGMDWHQLGQMVKAERRAGNPVRLDVTWSPASYAP